MRLRAFSRHAVRAVRRVDTGADRDDGAPMISQAAGGVSGGHPPGEVSIAFNLGSLRQLRCVVATIAQAHALGWIADLLVLIVHEIAANAIVHGGGRGRLRLWMETGQVRCQVTDHGPGFPADQRGTPPHPSRSATGGRGLWLAYQFCQVEIHTGSGGTTVDLAIPAWPHRPSPGAPSGRSCRIRRGHPR